MRTGARADGWLLDALVDGVVLLDADLCVRFVNRAAAQMLGLRRDEIVGQELAAELPLPGADGAAYHEVMRTGTPLTLRSIRLTGPAHPDRLFDAEIHPSPEGGVAIVFRDVTKRARLRQARLAATEAEAANKAKSQFLGMMSHEIRTPINAILGYAELLELGIPGPLTDAQRIQLGRVRASASHLIGLVNEVLDIAKVESGQLTVERERASVADAVSAALALVRPDAAVHGVTIVEQCAAANGDHYVGDEQRVRQIVTNLVSNAIKFTEPGGRIAVMCGTVTGGDTGASLSAEDSWVFVRVDDTGIGIPEDQLAAIFEPFVQVATEHTQRRDGTGLGLAISRRLARLMGGDLTVQSQIDKGSTFTLWLPSAASEDVAAVRHVAREQQARHATLAAIGARLDREVRPVLTAFIRRLRTDPVLTPAHALTDPQLEDHAAAFLADVIQQLIIIGESGGEVSPLMRDGTEIQTLIANRHGAQRFRFGWTEDQLHHEFGLLREEMHDAIERVAPPGDTPALGAASAIIDRLLEFAERVSMRGFRLAAAARGR